MRFRRLYWVTEQFDNDGSSEVTGIFTSIPDLIELGLGTRPVSSKQAGFRITLCALDSVQPPFLSASSPDFSEVATMLTPMIEEGEITKERARSLCDALKATK